MKYDVKDVNLAHQVVRNALRWASNDMPVLAQVEEAL